MTTIAFISPKGAPGVTTAACAIAAVWPAPRDVLLVECDPSGGDLAPRFGLPTTPGLTSYVLARRDTDRGSTDALDHVQTLPGGLAALFGPVGGEVAMALDGEVGAIGLEPSSMGSDVLLDCGRFNPRATGQALLLRQADLVALVTRADATSVAHGRCLVDTLSATRDIARATGLVVVGEGDRKSVV